MIAINLDPYEHQVRLVEEWEPKAGIVKLSVQEEAYGERWTNTKCFTRREYGSREWPELRAYVWKSLAQELCFEREKRHAQTQD